MSAWITGAGKKISPAAVIQPAVPARIVSADVDTQEGVLERAPDSELMARLTVRDQRALVELYRRHARRLYPLIRRIVTSEGLAEEILQDVFVRLWTRAALYRAEEGHLLAWLITMARNLALDALRKDSRWRGQLEFEEALHDATPADHPAPDVDTTLSVRHALDTLPDDQRRAVELAYFAGMTHAELAAHLNQPLGTVKSRLRLALDKLRGALGQVRRVRMAP